MRHLAIIVGCALVLGGSVGAEEVDFEQQVLPILRQRCFECHGADKQKSDLRLDTKEGLFQEDYIVVPEDPEESELVIRISLPADDDDKMPPKGDRLTADQIELIRGWIGAGAVWPDGLVAATPARPKRPSPLERLTAIEPTAAEAAAIEKLGELGVVVRPVAADMLWKTANLRGLPRENLRSALDALAEVTTLTDVNLADCQLTDDDVAQLSSLTNLTRLHLEKNSITDAALAHLEPLVQLDYLNLYGTQVSDAGLAWLKPMKHLRKLYVWQTEVTDEGATALRELLPSVDVVMGATLAAPPPAEEKDSQESSQAAVEPAAAPQATKDDG